MKALLPILFFISSCNYFQSLPAEMDGEKVPPMPDEVENNRTIAGIDSNGNGVRDDVELWILKNFDDPNLRKGMKQFARYKTLSMLAAGDRQKSIELTHKYLDTLMCIYEIVGSSYETRGYIRNLESEIANTEERLKTTARVSVNFAGQGGELKDREYYLNKCEFKIE